MGRNLQQSKRTDFTQQMNVCNIPAAPPFLPKNFLTIKLLVVKKGTCFVLLESQLFLIGIILHHKTIISIWHYTEFLFCMLIVAINY